MNAINDAPVVTDIPGETIFEGASFATVPLNDYVSDVDNSDAQMTWSYTGTTDLTVSIDPVTHVATISAPNDDWSGAETITFTATDPGLLFDADDATFTVTAVNDAPVAVPDAYDVAEDGTLTVDARPACSATTPTPRTTPSPPSWWTTSPAARSALAADGSFTYAAGRRLQRHRLLHLHGQRRPAVSNEATVTITVNAVNDAPVAVANAYSTAEDTLLTVAAPGVLGNDSDVEGEHPHRRPGGTTPRTARSTWPPTVPSPTPPAANYNGTDSFTYKANDGTADSARPPSPSP